MISYVKYRCCYTLLCCLLWACPTYATANDQETIRTAQLQADKSLVDTKALAISVVERPPFVIQQGKRLTGFSIELWSSIARELGRDSSYEVHTSFADMLETVTTQRSDLAIANISITSERESVMDFSQPIFDSGLQILVPASGSSNGLLDAILTWRMLTIILVAVLVVFVVGNLMWYFEKDKSPYFQKSYRDGLWPSFWWAMSALISGDFKDHMPSSIPGRILGMTTLISTLFIISAFTATLTSVMTLSELRSGIQGINDLHGSTVGTTRGSTAAILLRERGIEPREYDQIDELFNDVAHNKLHAAVHDAPILAYHVATKGHGQVQLAGQVFKAEKYGIALPENSALTERINRTLLKIRESGEYEDLYRKWFGNT